MRQKRAEHVADKHRASEAVRSSRRAFRALDLERSDEEMARRQQMHDHVLLARYQL